MRARESEPGSAVGICVEPPIAVGSKTAASGPRRCRHQATTSPLNRIAGIAQVMHAEGLVHRDIKPGNIMRCRDERAGGETYKLIDFGTALGVDERVARLSMMTIGTNRGIGAGTPPYMSPEMFKVRSAVAAAVEGGGRPSGPRHAIPVRCAGRGADAAGSAAATARGLPLEGGRSARPRRAWAGRAR